MLTPEVGSFWISKNNPSVKAEVVRIENYGSEDHILYNQWIQIDESRWLRAMQSNISVEAFLACYDPVIIPIRSN